MSKTKKIVFLFVALSLATIGTKYYWDYTHYEHYFNQESYCPFCDPAVIANQRFYEDDKVIGLYNYKPDLPGHCLIVPKRHIKRFELATDEEISSMMKLIKKINTAVSKAYGTDAYLLLQKNGLAMGQTVPHIHFHYIPRKDNGHFPFTLLLKLLWPNLTRKISPNEMRQNIEKIKHALIS